MTLLTRYFCRRVTKLQAIILHKCCIPHPCTCVISSAVSCVTGHYHKLKKKFLITQKKLHMNEMSMYGHENYPRGNTSFFVVMLWIIDP